MHPWHNPTQWQALRSGVNCPLCAAREAEAVAQLSCGWLRVPESTCLPGYVCLVYGRHVPELHNLTPPEAAALVTDVQRVSRALQHLTRAIKINLLSLGNQVPHLHVHIVPRHAGDRFESTMLDVGDVRDDSYRPGEHAEFVRNLVAELAHA